MPNTVPRTPQAPSLAQLAGPDWENQLHLSTWSGQPFQFNAGGRNMVLERLGDGLGFIAYDPADRYGSGATYFDPSGNFTNQQAWREASNNMLVPALATAGIMFGIPALMGEGAGAGAAAGVGELGAFEGTGLTFGGGSTGALGAGGATLAAEGIAPSVALTPVEIAAGSSTVAPVVAEGGAALGGMGGALGAGAANLPGAAEAGLASVGGAGGAAAGGSILPGWAGTALQYGAPIVGGLISAGAAKSAAGKMADATNSANALLQQQYQQTRSDLEPWRTAGVSANNVLAQKMGTGGNAQAADYGELTRDFTGQDLQNEPGYKFGLDEGMNALNNRLAAQGSYFSGAGLKGGIRFANDYASTKFNDAYNRDSQNKTRTYNFLSGQSALGENAAAQTGNFGAQTASSIANNTTALGNAQGAAGIAGANAIGNALGSVAATYNQNELLDKVLGTNSATRRVLGGNVAWS